MNKGRITSQEDMALEQIQEDIAMSPLERLEVAFRLSDLANEIQKKTGNVMEENSSIQWIELRKIASPK
jgi:hypothetical protein